MSKAQHNVTCVVTLVTARAVADYLRATPNELPRLRSEDHGPASGKLNRNVSHRCVGSMFAHRTTSRYNK